MTECQVDLVDIMLDKTIKIVDGTAKLPNDGRKKYVCTICRKRFLTSKELAQHRPTHEENEEETDEDDDVIIISEKPRKKLVPVKRTKPTPKTTNTIKNYFQKAEKIEKTETEEVRKRPLLCHKCETCDSNFTSVDDIKLHTASTCRFKCGVCHKTYNTVYAFTVHALQHKINLFNTSFIPDKLHKCSLCPESFDDYIDLKTHGIVKHKAKSRSESESEDIPDETNGDNIDTEISCELCFDIFESQEELLEHMEFHKELGEKPEKKMQEEHSADNEENSEKLTEEDDSKSPENPTIVAEEGINRKTPIELNPIPVIESSYSLAAEPAPLPAEPVEQEKKEEEKTEEGKSAEEESNLKYIVLPANDMIPKKHYKCNKCERIYTSIEEFDSHIPKKCKIENVCPVCLTTISTNSEWYTHITEKHRRWATCKYCFETFNEIKKLDQHKAIKHFNSFKNVCKICYKSFATYEEFDEHLKKEHLNLSADSSGKLSLKEKLTKYGITREIVVLLQDVKLDKNFEFDGDTVILTDERKKKFTCYVCMAKFSTSQSMNKHKAMHSDSELEDDPRGEDTWSEPKSKSPPRNIYSRHNLKPKLASGAEDMNKICDKTKRDETVTNQTQKATPFKCETCDVFFESSDDAKLHTVSNKCKFLCKICGRKFNTLYAFVVHVMQHRSNAARSQGSTQLVYTCATCKQSFDNCLLLRSHEINTHAPKPAPREPEPVIEEPKELNATVKEEPMEPPVQDQVPANNAAEEETNEICCELCYDIFESEEELKAHMEFHEQLENKSDTIVIEDDEDEVVEIFEEKKDPHEIITTIKSTPRPPQQKNVKPPEVRPDQATTVTTSLKTKSTHTLTAAITDMLTPRTEKQSKAILLPPVSLPSLIPVNRLKKKVETAAKTVPQSENPNLELRRTGPLSYSFCFKEDGTLGTTSSKKTTVTTTNSSVTTTTNSPTVSIKVPISATARNFNRIVTVPSTSSTSTVTNGPNLQFFITNVPYAPTLQTAGTSTASTVTNSTVATTSSTLTRSTNASNFTYVVAPSAAFASPIVVNDPKTNLAYVILPHTNTGIINPTASIQNSECVVKPQLPTTNTLATIDLTETQASTAATATTTTNTISNGQSQSSVSVTTTPVITDYFTTSENSTDTAKASSLPVITDCFTASANPEPAPFHILSDYLIASGNSEPNVANTTSPTTDSTSTATTSTTNVANKENEESIVIDSDSSAEENPKEQTTVKESTGNESESDELVIDESASTEPSEKKDDGTVAESQDEEEKAKKKKYKFPMKCEGCSVIFLRMRSMRHHLDRRHACQLCSFKCCKLSDLKQHYILEHHKYFCSRCSILSDNRRAFTDHNRRNHICQLCNGFYFNLTHHTCPKTGENDKNDGKNDKNDGKNEKDDGKNEKKE